MAFAAFSPKWFYGYDVALELSFAIILLIVSIFAFRIYQKTYQKQVRLFGISFLMISLSYLIQSIFNFLSLSRLNLDICRAINIQSTLLFDLIGMYTHMFFMTIGLVILVYMTLKIDKLRVLWLLTAISLLAVFLAKNALYIFFVLSTIYLTFISYHFITNYLRNKQIRTLLIALAFLFLLFGHLHFIVSVNHQLFYAVGHVLELLAYLLILINLYLVRKR